EFRFFMESDERLKSLDNSLRENGLSIQYPVTRFDQELGRIYRYCPSTEEQALRRIEVKERIELEKKRIKKRNERLLRVFEKLDEFEKGVIWHCFMVPFMGAKHMEITNKIPNPTSEFNQNELEKVKKSAILKIFKAYEEEREESFEKKRIKKAKKLRKIIQEFKAP